MTTHVGPGTLGYDNVEGVFKFGQLVWDSGTLTWVRMTQPGGVGGGGMTDAEFTAHLPLNVSGPLTDAQLRASAVPVSAAALPLPTGASTETTLAAVNTATGAQADAEAAGNGSVIAVLKRLRTLLSAGLPAALVGGRLDVNVGNTPTVTANAGANLNTSALALDATLTGGTTKAIARGGAKGATAAADLTSTAQGANNQALDVQLYHGGVAKDPTQIRALTAADVVTATGDVAHDAVDSGNPIKIGGIARAALTAVSAALDRVAAMFDVYGRQVVAKKDTFAVQHQPAAATQATIAKASAGAGIKNVCTSITVTLSSTAAPTAARVIFNLRDGASGAGTILWSVGLSIPAVAGQAIALSLTDLWIEGTAATAMTLESAAAPGANTFATVAMTGTITQ